MLFSVIISFEERIRYIYDCGVIHVPFADVLAAMALCCAIFRIYLL